MVFIAFGTLMQWSELLSHTTKGIDSIIGKIVFILAVIGIALILLVQKLNVKWIIRISLLIILCLVYYTFTFNYQANVETYSFNEGFKSIGEGIYFTLVSSLLTLIACYFAKNNQSQ